MTGTDGSAAARHHGATGDQTLFPMISLDLNTLACLVEIGNLFACLHAMFLKISVPVSERLSRNLRLPEGILRIEVKGEMGEKFPGKFGLKHDIPTAQDVLRFYDKMVHSTRSDRDRWVVVF